MTTGYAISRLAQAAAEARVYVTARTLEAALLERRYRPDQPRAPRGMPEGGQWVNHAGGVRRDADIIAKIVRSARRAIRVQAVADLADDLAKLGGGTPRVLRTPKGAPLFIFPNGWVLRFDLLPGQYLRGQSPHINLELPGVYNIHIDVR